MTMSAPVSATTHYIMLECGCRGVVAEPLLVHQVLVCPKHGTAHRYILEHALRLPLYTRLSPVRLFRWLGRKPKTPAQAAGKLMVCFGIGYVTFGVAYLIVNYALRG